jgi:hypothetical protein
VIGLSVTHVSGCTVRVLQKFNNAFEHAIHLKQHFLIPEAQHPETRLLNEPRPHCVTHNALCVLPAVQLDYQAAFQASEIGDVLADRMLAAKLEPAEPLGERVVRLRKPSRSQSRQTEFNSNAFAWDPSAL